MDYTKEIREFVVSNFLYGERGSFTDDTSFLESGVIDSTGMLDLISFLESTYGIRIAPEEMVPENLDSVGQAASFLQKKLIPAQAGAVS